MSDEFEFRTIIGRPAYEKRHDDPARNYGIGGLALHFALIGPEGAVSLEVLTGWFLPHVRERLRRETDHAPHFASGNPARCAFEPTAGPMCSHDHRRRHNHYAAEPDDCDLLPGGKCWGDHGYLAGDQLLEALIAGGEPGLRDAMRGWYDAMIDEPAG